MILHIPSQVNILKMVLAGWSFSESTAGWRPERNSLNPCACFHIWLMWEMQRALALHPSSTSHSQLNERQQKESGLTPDLIRLSIGIESIEDILNDLEQAFAEI